MNMHENIFICLFSVPTAMCSSCYEQTYVNNATKIQFLL